MNGLALFLIAVFIPVAAGYLHLKFFFGRKGDTWKEAPFLIVGLDGGCWEVIRSLISQGKLPHIESVIRSGVSGDMIPESPFSPPSWTTLSTGLPTDRHGIYHFTIHEAGSYDRSLARPHMIQGTNLWERVESEGGKVGVLGWFLTPKYPCRMVSRREKYLLALTMDIRWIASKLYLKWLRRTRAPFEKICPVQENTTAEWYMALALHLLRRDRIRFLGIRFYGSDAFQHLFWKYAHPDYYDVDPADVRRYGSRIGDFYRKVDRFVGELSRTGAKNLIIVSDHGFQGYSREAVQPFWLIYDFNYNRLLQRLGLLHYREGESETVDWGRTQAYSCGDPRAFHEIAINLKGRETHGVVLPADYEAIRGKIQKALEEIRFEDTGERLFGKVSLHDGTPYGRFMTFRVLGEEFRLWNNDAFDLLIEDQFSCRFQDEALLKRRVVVGDRSYPFEDFVTPSVWSATHSLKGIFMARGEGIRPGMIAEVSSLDIAPTLLYWMGMSIPKSMEGKVRTEIYQDSFVRDRPIKTSDDERMKRSDDERPSREEEERIKEELHNLGYL